MFSASGPLRPPPPADHAPEAILERIRSLEASVARIDELAEDWTERELKWAEMNAQLRRFLGRLDAHAGHAARAAEETQQIYRPDVIAAKYPNGVPTKGG